MAEGLSPKQNREIPPLDYGRVRRLKRQFPALQVILNGGLKDEHAALAELGHVDGVMLGRAAYDDPMLLGRLDAALFRHAPVPVLDALERYFDYAAQEVGRGTRLHAITRHLMGVFAGRPGGRRWRGALGEWPGTGDDSAALDALRALAHNVANGEASRAA